MIAIEINDVTFFVTNLKAKTHCCCDNKTNQKEQNRTSGSNNFHQDTLRLEQIGCWLAGKQVNRLVGDKLS